MKKHRLTRSQIAGRWLLFWTVFIGIGAVAGAMGMLLDPSGKAMGMDTMLPYFQVLPFADVLFQNYTFSGIALLIVNGHNKRMATKLHKRTMIHLGAFFNTVVLNIKRASTSQLTAMLILRIFKKSSFMIYLLSGCGRSSAELHQDRLGIGSGAW